MAHPQGNARCYARWRRPAYYREPDAGEAAEPEKKEKREVKPERQKKGSAEASAEPLVRPVSTDERLREESSPANLARLAMGGTAFPDEYVSPNGFLAACARWPRSIVPDRTCVRRSNRLVQEAPKRLRRPQQMRGLNAGYAADFPSFRALRAASITPVLACVQTWY